MTTSEAGVDAELGCSDPGIHAPKEFIMCVRPLYAWARRRRNCDRVQKCMSHSVKYAGLGNDRRALPLGSSVPKLGQFAP
jgi:hypothetical protein